MTFIRNFLPQGVHGTTSSASKEIVFLKDSNYEEEYTYAQETLPYKKVQPTANQLRYYSINDYPSSEFPLTFIHFSANALRVAGWVNSPGQITYKLVSMPEIERDVRDVFGCFTKKIENESSDVLADFMVVYIPYNDSKYFYMASLSDELTAIDTTYNTVDGSETGTAITETKMFVVLDVYLVLFGGTDTVGVRCYKYDWDSNTLSFVTRWTTTINNVPTNRAGGFRQINDHQIIGMACTNSTESYLFTFSISGDDITCTARKYIPVDGDGNGLSDSGYHTNVSAEAGICIYFNQKPLFVAYPERAGDYLAYRTAMMRDGLYWKSEQRTSTNNLYLYEGIGLSNTIAILISNVKKNIQKIEMNANGALVYTTLHTITDNTLVYKIPGIPMLYVDPDYTEEDVVPIIYYSKVPSMPTLLPPGSTINGTEQKDFQMIFPQEGTVELKPSSQTLSKKFYVTRNKNGGVLFDNS